MSLTQHQKSTFIQNIKNENYLRKEILIPIFRNMKKFTVIDTHGADEKEITSLDQLKLKKLIEG